MSPTSLFVQARLTYSTLSDDISGPKEALVWALESHTRRGMRIHAIKQADCSRPMDRVAVIATGSKNSARIISDFIKDILTDAKELERRRFVLPAFTIH